MADMAFALRERCGCVVGVTVEDAAMHYVQTVAAWQRSAKRCSIERMTVEDARAELGRTFESERLRGKRHWRQAGDFLCRPDLAPPPPASVMPDTAGVDDAKADAALTARSAATPGTRSGPR